MVLVGLSVVLPYPSPSHPTLRTQVWLRLRGWPRGEHMTNQNQSDAFPGNNRWIWVWWVGWAVTGNPLSAGGYEPGAE